MLLFNHVSCWKSWCFAFCSAAIYAVHCCAFLHGVMLYHAVSIIHNRCCARLTHEARAHSLHHLLKSCVRSTPAQARAQLKHLRCLPSLGFSQPAVQQIQPPQRAMSMFWHPSLRVASQDTFARRINMLLHACFAFL